MNVIYDTCFSFPSTVTYIGVKFRIKIIFGMMKELKNSVSQEGNGARIS